MLALSQYGMLELLEFQVPFYLLLPHSGRPSPEGKQLLSPLAGFVVSQQSLSADSANVDVVAA